MLFNSLHFLFFFAVIVPLYYLVPTRYRPGILLTASCYFYMVFMPVYILVIFFLIIIDYILGLKIEKSEGKKRKKLLIISIFANLSTLFLFKYFNFFSENIQQLASLLHWNYSPFILKILLPVGLSFHVFQSLSYVIEVYKGKQKSEKNFAIYALYVMFFPQLVAGPIERPQHLLPQLHKVQPFQATNVTRGLERMLWGFFKKLVIADRLALVVNHIYGNLHQEHGLLLLLVIILFAYQLYADFSGYSDIAIGAALVLGYNLSENFNRPYVSKSIAEFWRRWHISLSTWLRDYLYYPLFFAGSKRSKARIYVSIITTFVLIGLWHGANWTYIIFGALHGLFLSFSALTVSVRRTISKATGIFRFPFLYATWQTLTTFLLASVSFVFFRAETLADASYLLRRAGYTLYTIFDVSTLRQLINPTYLRKEIFEEPMLGVSTTYLFITIFAIIALEIVQYLRSYDHLWIQSAQRSLPIRLGWYYALCFSILFLGHFGSAGFIYFQF